MAIRFLGFVALSMIVAIFFRGDWAHAQQAQRPGAMVQQKALPKPGEWTINGKLAGIRPGPILQVEMQGGQSMFVRMQRDVRIRMTGKAKVDFLAPGHCISFVAEIEKRTGRATAAVDTLTLFTPTDRKKLGALPDQGNSSFGKPKAAKDKDKESASAGSDKKAKAKDDFGDLTFGGGREKTASGLRPAGAGKSATAPSETFEVNGQIKQIRNGRITLLVPNIYIPKTVQIEVSDDPDIDVEIGDPNYLQLAQQGDSVVVRGTQINEQVGMAAEIELAFSKPLTAGTGTAGRKHAPAKSGSMRGKKAAAADSEASEEDDGPATKATKKTSRTTKKSTVRPKATEGDDAMTSDDDAADAASPTKKTMKKPAKRPAAKDSGQSPSWDPDAGAAPAKGDEASDDKPLAKKAAEKKAKSKAKSADDDEGLLKSPDE
jgi:hypothetical protein